MVGHRRRSRFGLPARATPNPTATKKRRKENKDEEEGKREEEREEGKKGKREEVSFSSNPG